jgi:chromosome segregation ATPase
MTLLNAALAFIFFCNLVFMVGAGYLLLRILQTTETSQINLQKAASSVIETGTHVKVIVRRAFNEMERNNDALSARESSTGRAVAELSFQIKTLVERIKMLLAKQSADKDSGLGLAAADKRPPDAEELRTILHSELSAVMAKNQALQDEIDQTRYRLKDASKANAELREEISDVKGVKQSVVDSLLQRTTELEAQLEQARERANAAEKHAEANATKLDDIREQINTQQFSATGGVDQTELIQSQQDQIDVLADREKELLLRITQLESAFQRNQTEKNFIEERFLQLDAGQTAQAPLDPPAAS